MTMASTTNTASLTKSGASFPTPTWSETDTHARLSPGSVAFSRKVSLALSGAKPPKLTGLVRAK
jgi:hypothetical protein